MIVLVCYITKWPISGIIPRTGGLLNNDSLGIWAQHFFQIKHLKWFTGLIQNERSISLNRMTCMTKDSHTVESLLFPEIAVSRGRDGVLMV